MKALLNQVVFAVGSHAYDWADVAIAAGLWGDWALLEEEVRQGLACVRRLEDTDVETDPDEVTRAADEFRYERDLLTAAEAEAWLERWGLTAETWMDYIERSVLRREWADELPGIVAAYPVERDTVTNAIGAEGVCSGHFPRFARKLAGRAAVHQRMQEEGPGETPSDLKEGEATTVDGPELPGVEPNVRREKVATLARLEFAFRRFRQMVLTPQAIRDAVGARDLDWIRLRCRILSFPEEQMAQEAALCIREDGTDLLEVGRRAKVAGDEAGSFLDETDPGSRQALLSAVPGDLLGPLAINGGFFLFRVIEKVLPSIEDPAVQQRAEREVLEHTVEREISNRVRWQVPL